MNAHVSEAHSIEAAALAQLFTEARTHNGFVDRPVSDELLKKAVELAKMGPTSANQSPMRIVFLKSEASRARLLPAMSPGNLEKTRTAPVTAITAYDEKFYEHLPFLFPHADAKPWFSGNEAFAKRSAFQNGTLQVAYLILALRAVGLDTGPMTGFDREKVDAEFFPEGSFKSNVVINIGYGDHSKLFPRSPRFAFDQMAKILGTHFARAGKAARAQAQFLAGAIRIDGPRNNQQNNQLSSPRKRGPRGHKHVGAPRIPAFAGMTSA